MGIALDWVRMPEGTCFRTICRDGVPVAEPTRYLFSYVHPGATSRHTVLNYAERLLPFWKWLDRGGLELTAVTRLDLERFRRDLVLQATTVEPLLKKGPKSSPKTIHATLAATIRFFAWAMEPDDTYPILGPPQERRGRRSRLRLSRLNADEIARLSKDLLPRLKRTLPSTLTQEQLDRCRRWIMQTFAFDAVLQIRNRAMFETLWDGALRKGALLALRTNGIDWLARTLTVSFGVADYRATWFRKGRNHRAVKTGEYVVTVSDETIQWLDRYRQEARPHQADVLDHGLFFCEHAPGGADDGRPLDNTTLRYLFMAMSAPETRGGLGLRVTPHMLRHTWAVMAEEDGLDLEVRQHHLGHALAQTTELYSHVAPERVREDLARWRQQHPERYGRISR